MAAMRESRDASGPAASSDLRPGSFTAKPVGCCAPSIASMGPSILRRSTLPWCTGPLPKGVTLPWCLPFSLPPPPGSSPALAIAPPAPAPPTKLPPLSKGEGMVLAPAAVVVAAGGGVLSATAVGGDAADDCCDAVATGSGG